MVLLLALTLTMGYAQTAWAASTAVLTFSDDGITETQPGSGYTITGTTLSINVAGVYTVQGSCSEGNIEVAKGVSGVTLILNDLTLTSSSTAPIVVKKTASATIHLDGDNHLTNLEDPANETSSDITIAEAFEGACIKAKSGSSIVFCGDGTLTCDGSACKNGIKGGATAALTFNGGTYTVSAANNGIASDGSLVINAGVYDIDAGNDGIKSVPDVDDLESVGSLTINGGTFDLDVQGDGISAEADLTINGGSFDIYTYQGHSVWNDSLSESLSCKGIKASGDREGVESALAITGGDFTLDCGDDAVHSDGSIMVTGGTFDIKTGDDGMHADTSLTLGVEGSSVARDPDVYVYSSYEGLEGETVTIYSGRYYVVASDDGINAAGGSSSGTDPGHNPWDPWGGGPGGGGQGGSSNCKIDIYGGDVFVNCTGDGIDSNGDLNLYGGNLNVFSQGRGGDNSPYDCDGTWLISGATVFGAGANQMNERPGGSSQRYFTQTTQRTAGTVLDVSYGGSKVYSTKVPRAISYLIYSDPSMTSTNCSVATASSVSACASDDWAHSWNDGVVTAPATSDTKGVITYTCTSCGKVETQSIPALASVPACEHDAGAVEPDKGYEVSFVVGEGASIDVYYTQDYAAPSESGVTSGVSRSSDTGMPDSSGGGQVNFAIVLEDGYALAGDPTVEGTYKALKDISAETGIAHAWRVTKVESGLTITVPTTTCAHQSVTAADLTWTWADDLSAVTLSYTCPDCGSHIQMAADLTSELTDSDTITFTTSALVGETTFTDSRTAAPFVVTFAGDEGVKAVNVYYSQDYATASEKGATTAVARDGDTGCPVVDGSGQVNFAIVLADGYELASVTPTAGTYKNLKDISVDAGVDNAYRMTKVTAGGTVEIVTIEKEVLPEGWYDFGDGAKGYVKNGALVKGWLDLDGGKYWFDEQTGKMATGWTDLVVDGKTMHYYFRPSGNLARGAWADIDGRKYWFRASGNMATGWATIDGKKYYFDEGGQMVTGWRDIVNDNGVTNHYYFRPSGAMATEWATIDGASYYFRPSGNMATGFCDVVSDAYKRYFDEGGRMLTGWQTINGQTYYFRASGAMQTGTATIDGTEYVFSDKGVLIEEQVTLAAAAPDVAPEGDVAAEAAEAEVDMPDGSMPNEAEAETDGLDVLFEGTCGDCVWTVDSKGVLTIGPAEGQDEGTLADAPATDGEVEAAGVFGWLDPEIAPQVKRVVVLEGTKAGKSLSGAFAGLENLEFADLSGLDATDAEGLEALGEYTGLKDLEGTDILVLLFDGCEKLSEVILTLEA